MRGISEKVKKVLKKEPRMSRCEWCGSFEVQWHHVLQYAGKQIDEPFAIASACFRGDGKGCHQLVTRKASEDLREKQKIEAMKSYFELNAILRMNQADRAKYSKFNWVQRKDYLARILLGYSGFLPKKM